MATALVYGAPGSGKTINTTRIPGKTLLISSDNSAMVLNNFERPNLTVKEAANFKMFVDLFEEATSSEHYDNIIVDCLTDLIDAYIVEIREGGVGGDIRQHYLAIYTKVKFLVRKAAFCNTNCIFNCWEDVETITLESGEIANRVSPMLPAKIKQQVCGLCNVVARVTSALDKQGNRQWYFATEGNEVRMAKDQLYLRKNCVPEKLFEKPEEAK
jgi:phage nucleotide-binding protein